MVGGGTVVNGMFFARGSAGDYDAWENLGNPGWGWEGLLPYFKKVSLLPRSLPRTQSVMFADCKCRAKHSHLRPPRSKRTFPGSSQPTSRLMEPKDLYDPASPITSIPLSVSRLNEFPMLLLTHDLIELNVLIQSAKQRQFLRRLAEHRSGRTTATQRW